MRVLGCIVIALILTGCGKSEAEKAVQREKKAEIKMQRLAREFVAAHLKDPASAEYQNQRAMCGEVNSKNAMGGYTGFQRFIASNKELVVLERDSGLGRADFEEVWRTVCK